MEPREDSWESIGWETSSAEPDDVDRQQVLELARRLADQRQRQRAEDLVQIEDLKRALRERAADVARRELEVERRLQELDGRETPRRSLRFRRAERQPVEDSGDEAYGEELLFRRDTELEDRARTLAAREREVATLIAQGKINREIAEDLVVSERTVESHVSNIMFKLGVQSRRQIRDWAVQKGLASHH